MCSSLRLSTAFLLLPAPLLLAQEAKVLGPQSPVETYPAPAATVRSVEGLIDFPKLISEPGADDGVQITPKLVGFDIQILGTEGSDEGGGYVRIAGLSRTGKDRAHLYASLRAKLAVHRDLALTLGDTRIIQQDIAEVYRVNGYPLMSVVVPPQEIVGGRLRLQINEFSLAGYKVAYGDGQGAYSPAASHRSDERRLAALLDPLLKEPVLRQASLDKKVKWLNAGPYRQARVIFEPGKQPGESVAQIQIDEQRPWSVQAGYNNHATKSSGTDRYSIGGAMGYLPFENHQVSWNVTTGNRFDEFANYSLTYTAPLPWGHRLIANANYSDTASSTNPSIPGSASTTLQTSLGYELPLVAKERFTWDLGITSFLKRFERESLFGGLVVGGAHFDSVQLVVDNRLGWKEPTATNQFTFATTFSLEGLTDRNTDDDFRTFHNTATGGAATQHFVVNYARVQQLAPLLGASFDGWSTESQLSWQFTGDQLAGSDNFAIGGPQVMRAYQSSEVAGDDGVYAIQFLHFKPLAAGSLGVAGKWIQQLSPSLFIEGGQGTFKSGASDSLWDYGVQLAAEAKPGLSVTSSLAVAGRESAQTDRGDLRFFVSAQLRY